MLDFTSALYLGLEHASWNLPGWPSLTLGKPSAFEQLPGISEVERKLAELVGCDRAVIGTSTLHLFWDLFRWLSKAIGAIFVDSDAYPIARWAVGATCSASLPVRYFTSCNWQSVWKDIRHLHRVKPVIVTDGFFPASGRHAPLKKYAAAVEESRGLLVIDDTQAVGVLGSNAGPRSPYGLGGGGSLKAFGLSSDRIVQISSLAKAFGAPLAMLAGSQQTVEEFLAHSATRVHCSPPAAPLIAAAANALAINARCGDLLRSRLLNRVALFRSAMACNATSAKLNADVFPLQPVLLPASVDVVCLHRRMLRRGVATILHSSPQNAGAAAISLAFTARHQRIEVLQAVEVLNAELERTSNGISKGGS